MADVEVLYKSYGVLADAGENVAQHTAEYEALITGTKGSTGSKRLAADFITKFFAHFPDIADRAIEAQLDLCEDEDQQVRQAAIKALPLLCREGMDNSQIGDVLAQLLQSDSALETKIVRNALISLLKKDTKAGLAGLFLQIVSTEVLAKDRAVAFLGTVLVDLVPELVNPHPEIEEYILSEAKDALKHVTGTQFSSVMLVLRKLKCTSAQAGIQKLAEVLATVGGFSAADEPTEGEAMLRAVACASEAAHLCKRGAAPKVFIDYLVKVALPSLGSLPEDVQLMAAKGLALLVHPLVMKQEDIQALCEPALEGLMSLLPEAPQPTESDEAPATPEINYRVAESVLYAFHQLAKKCPEFMHSDEEATTRLRLLKVRLQFLGLCCQSALKDLKASQATEAAVTIKAIQNISLLIKTFLKAPPSYQTSFTLSFAKPVTAPAAYSTVTSPTSDTTAQKRPAPATAGADVPKRPMTGKELREQYSTAAPGGRPQQQQKQPPQQGGRSYTNRGGGRGQFRGRGQGRGSFRPRTNNDWKGPNF